MSLAKLTGPGKGDGPLEMPVEAERLYLSNRPLSNDRGLGRRIESTGDALKMNGAIAEAVMVDRDRSGLTRI